MVRLAKTQISLGIRPVWSESSLCAQWVAKDPSFLHASVMILIRLGGCPGWSGALLGAHAILLVLSRGGSFVISILSILSGPRQWSSNRLFDYTCIIWSAGFAKKFEQMNQQLYLLCPQHRRGILIGLGIDLEILYLEWAWKISRPYFVPISLNLSLQSYALF